jgi:hypothetical protein
MLVTSPGEYTAVHAYNTTPNTKDAHRGPPPFSEFRSFQQKFFSLTLEYLVLSGTII